MKKSSLFSLIVYIFYTLGGIGLALYSMITLKTSQDGELVWGAFGFGLEINVVLGIIGGAIGLLGLILKLVHIKTDWGFFGFLCIIVDIVFAIAWLTMSVPASILHSIPFIVISVASAVANAISLKD